MERGNIVMCVLCFGKVFPSLAFPVASECRIASTPFLRTPRKGDSL